MGLLLAYFGCFSRLYPFLQEILEVEQIMDEDTGMALSNENIEKVLDEIRPYLVGQCSTQAANDSLAPS